jgi:N-acetylglucosamine-6-sulfatase
MHDAGYETAFIGKWHMGLDDSPRPGFDRWVGFKGQGVYNDPTLNVDGKIEKTNGYITDILNGYAVDFINSDHKKPFLLYLAHKAVHGPFTAAERHKSLYADAVFKPAASANDSLEDKPALKRPAVGNDPEKASAPKKGKKAGSGAGTIERNQLRALAAVDEGVGQLFEALQKTGHLNDTLVVFTSDNGFFWGEHGLSDKRWAYDESIRDPLLMRYPRLVKPGRVLEQFVLNIDLAPTFLELAGAPVPKSIQGRSILSILNDPKASWRNSFMTEYFQEKQYPQTPTWQAVRTSRWKYIRYQDSSGLDELYDLQKDPYELKNLVHDALAQSALKDAQRELERLETDLGFSRTQTNTNERSVPPL